MGPEKQASRALGSRMVHSKQVGSLLLKQLMHAYDCRQCRLIVSQGPAGLQATKPSRVETPLQHSIDEPATHA